jgi:hypothetical protein
VTAGYDGVVWLAVFAGLVVWQDARTVVLAVLSLWLAYRAHKSRSGTT